jgi:hypothetical protein
MFLPHCPQLRNDFGSGVQASPAKASRACTPYTQVVKLRLTTLCISKKALDFFIAKPIAKAMGLLT